MASASNSIIVACWVIFLAYWIVSARRAKPTVERQSVLSLLAHRLPIGLGWWMLAYPGLPPPMNQVLIPRTDWALVSGVLVCLLGLFVTIWARRTLAGNWSSDVTFKQGHELVRSGPYRFARHPIYTGLLVMCLGSAIEIGRLRCFVGIAVVLIGFWIKLKQEVRLLLRHFPDAYPAYQRKVKALVPFIL